ncbi:protein of unknown function (plasmid) [Caballeronia sp. S22]
MPAFIEPQLATLVERHPTGGDWSYEINSTNRRAAACLVALFATLPSRRLRAMEYFPEKP